MRNQEIQIKMIITIQNYGNEQYPTNEWPYTVYVYIKCFYVSNVYSYHYNGATKIEMERQITT